MDNDEMPLTPQPQSVLSAKPQEQAEDVYALGRDYKAAVRLNYQQYLWRESLGYNLHPLITQDILPTINRNTTVSAEPIQASAQAAPLLIADIACGTASWLRAIAQELSQDHPVELHGYAISLAQCPPQQWLPQTITRSILCTHA